MQPTRSSDSVKIISLNRDDVLGRLRQIARLLCAEHPEVSDVRLFGSLARGDQTGMSDVDIIIVLNRSPEADRHRRILTFLPYFVLPRGVDCLVYTSSELEGLLKDHRFLQRVWNESFSLIFPQSFPTRL
jgi:predicted nucleotidyltransferase